MWQKEIKKTIFTLNVDNYAPDITEMTYPLLYKYAKKIGAKVHIIKDRKFPDAPPVYEKLQIYQLAQEMENDWNIYFDSDALIHPNMMDVTHLISKDTVLHHGNDFAPIRWKEDRFFLRDGRHIGSCNWMTVASDWCIDVWRPLDDLSIQEAIDNINPILDEVNSVTEASHLIDDYTLSRNIAKYGLKFKNFMNILEELKVGGAYFWHIYNVPHAEKVEKMKQILKEWRLV